MLLRDNSSPKLGQDQFHSGAEAKEYVQLFLSDMCFWEKTSDISNTSRVTSRSSSPLSVEEKRQPEYSTAKASSHEEKHDEKHEEPMPSEDDLRWKAAVDPVTGKTYYYNSLTRETQWEKPLEVRNFEKKLKKYRLRKERAFFREMEQNIKASLARGERIPGAQPEAIETVKVQPEVAKTSQPAATKKDVPKRSVRTISGMDEHVIVSLNQNISPRHNKGPAPSFACPQEGRHPSSHLSTINAPLPLSSKSEKPKSRADNKQRSGCEDSASNKSTATGGQNHMRRNTGGTIFVKSTMTDPDVKATIKCVCGVFRAHIVQAEQRKPPRASPKSTRQNFDVFRDDYQIPRRRRQLVSMPSLEEITTFYHEYFSRSQMEHDTIIMSLIYVERLIKATNGALTPTRENWRSLLFSCMIMASKVWDDLSMWNIDFSNVSLAIGITPYSLERINQLELSVLTCLNFDVRVPASEYAKYYFLIRNMLLRGGLLQAAPLSQEEAKRLEYRTSQYQSARVSNNTRNNRRALSVDWEWFRQNESAQQGQGPVLKDNLCVEQLIAA